MLYSTHAAETRPAVFRNGRSHRMHSTHVGQGVRILAAASIATLVLALSPLGTVRAQAAAPRYSYAGQRSVNYFTGIWGYIQNTTVTLANTNDHTGHWVGKTIFNPDGTVKQWMQTGNAIGHAGNKFFGNTWHYYLEYQDYTGG